MAVRSCVVAVLLAVMSASACDDTFSPVASSTAQFSVYGYLDASADTQWIRVMPIRPLVLTVPDSFGATVTVERIGSGQVIQLRDSVFRFTNYLHPEVGSEGAFLHNFWTTTRIEPGAQYRFTARRNGEPPSEAIVEIPRAYDVEVWHTQVQGQTDWLRLSGLKNVAFVRATTYFYDTCGTSAEYLSFLLPRPENDVHMIPVRKASVNARPGCGPATISKRELWAVGTEAPWPKGEVYSPTALAVPEGASNITNSIGFLGGVLTRLTPYETCTFQGGGAPVPLDCKLRYDAASATMRGTVSEVRCGDGAIDSVTVTMREVDGEPPSNRKVRTIMNNQFGVFEFGALEPGKRYGLQVRAKRVPDPFFGMIDIHNIHTDTLVFSPGERRQYDVRLTRFTPC